MYLLKKILLTLPVFLGIYTAVFFLQRMIPGNPADLVLGPDTSLQEKALWTKSMGLDESTWYQYIFSLKRIFLHLDFGKSYYDSKPIFDIILPRLMITSKLAICAFLLAAIVSVFLGVFAAMHAGKALDKAVHFLGISAISLPSFVVGPLLLYFFSVKFDIFPLNGHKENLSIVLPSLTLAIPLTAFSSRMIRAGLVDVMNDDFIRTAVSKGLSRKEALVFHGLKNAFLPALTIMGLQLGVLLSGTVLTEQIFGWPGLGSLTVEAVQSREYPVVAGCVLTMAFIYVFCNFIVDLLYQFIDPRVRG